ncbi:hypothetical protein [Streptomyces sp. NPDC090131]|uniref:hypothetical protein n=1 Tax=Streptomyces sp. NPDC090131 TaxID=3365954 RepID=UPI003825B450
MGAPRPPAGLYLSHRWLAGEEEDPTATCAYALVRDLEGTLLAAAPLYLVRDEPNDSYRPGTVLPPHLRPRVIAGARRGYHNTPLTAPGLGPDGQDACLTLLRDAARRFADHHGTTHWWPYLTTLAATRLAPVYPAPALRLQDDALIPLPGTGIEDYISGAASACAANAATSPLPPSTYAGRCSRTASRTPESSSADTSRATGTTGTASTR